MKGHIFGVAGLLVGLCKFRNIKGLCLLAETSGLYPDGEATREIIININKMFNFNIELKNLNIAAEETGKIVTVEEHYRIGGLGGAVAEVLSQERPTPMKMIGVDDQFASNGPYEELLGLYGLQSVQIAATVKEFLK